MSQGSVKKELPLDEVHWPGVLDLLSRRFELSFRQADEILQRFFKRFLRPFCVHWYIGRLSEEENSLLLAACECQGADVLVLSWHKELHLGAFGFLYQQAVQFEPRLKRRKDERPYGACRARIEVALLGRRLVLNSLGAVLCFQVCFLGLALALYVAAMGLLLYGMAVFLLFLHLPVPVTIAATKEASIGLGLLCFLMGLAVIFGRAVRNISALVWGKFRLWRRLRP